MKADLFLLSLSLSLQTMDKNGFSALGWDVSVSKDPSKKSNDDPVGDRGTLK